MRELLEAGSLDGDCLTVTGSTVAENLAALDPPAPDGEVVRPLSRPIHSTGGIAVLKGTLAPQGSVVKVAGLDQDPRFTGTARVFDGEQAALEAILEGSIEPGTVVVIRYEGPKGGPGMREMLAVTGAMKGRGTRGRLRARDRRQVLGRDARLLRRARRSRGGGRRADRPRRRRGPDPDRRRAQDPGPPGRRGRARSRGARRWSLHAPRYTTGVLAKYARLVTGAERGAVTEP